MVVGNAVKGGLLVLALVACSSQARDPAPVVAESATATRTTCYLGTIVTAPEDRLPLLLRRTVDPANRQIHVERSREDQRGMIVTSRTLATIDGDRFTILGTEGSMAFLGNGVLAGPAWDWSSWTSTSTYVDEDFLGLRVESRWQRTDTGFASEDIFTEDGFWAKVTAELNAFDCNTWDAAYAELGVFPPLASGGCARACRNYLALQVQSEAQDEPVPEEKQDPEQEHERLDRRVSAAIEASLATCVDQCIRVNDPENTECVAHSTTLRHLKRCPSRPASRASPAP